MAGNIKVGGNTIFTHTGAVGAGTVTLKDQSGNTILTDNGTAVSMGNLRLPTTGGIKDSSGNNILTESGGVVSAGPSLALGTTSNPLTKNIVMGSGYGLDFSAAAGSAVLDDYEEGEVQYPLVFGSTTHTGTYLSNNTKYIKIGNLVHYQVHADTGSNATLSASGQFKLNLPYAFYDSVTQNSPRLLWKTIYYASSWTQGNLYITEGSSQILVYNDSHSSAVSINSPNHIWVSLSVTYYTTS